MEKQGSGALLAALVVLLAIASVVFRLHPLMRLILIFAAGALGYRAAHSLGWIPRKRSETEDTDLE